MVWVSLLADLIISIALDVKGTAAVRLNFLADNQRVNLNGKRQETSVLSFPILVKLGIEWGRQALALGALDKSPQTEHELAWLGSFTAAVKLGRSAI
jgi:hypothetical protein